MFMLTVGLPLRYRWGAWQPSRSPVPSPPGEDDMRPLPLIRYGDPLLALLTLQSMGRL